MFPFYQIIRKYPLTTSILLLLTVSLTARAQNGFTTIEVSEAQNNKLAMGRTEDFTNMLSATRKPYVVFGTDFRGTRGFLISFNLETRQTVRYQLVDMMGRQIAAQDLKEVLDQTYAVQANSVSSGAYIMRVMVDGKCYSDKILFTP